MIGVRIRSLDRRNAEGGATRVLGGIAFDMDGPGTLAILGRSGIGKTTLLHAIAGLETGFDGEITGVSGRVGFVFQSPRLLPWRSALENLRIVAPDRPDDELRALLDSVGVGDASDLFPGQLSLGMSRRVAIARALAVRPSLLLLDEPFASLDLATAARLRGMLGRVLSDSGIPSILVTHDPAEALELADRIMVLGGQPAELRLDAAAADLDAEKLAASVAADQPG